MQNHYSPITTVTSSVTSVQLLPRRSARLGAIIFNDSTQTLWIRLGDEDATADDFTYELLTRGTVEIPYGFNGRVAGIWAGANGKARITEVY